jgi:hypothetical protein
MIESTFQTWEQVMEEAGNHVRRANIKRILQKRFPDVPQDVADRIDAIDDSARLQELFDRALDAKSLDDIPL